MPYDGDLEAYRQLIMEQRRKERSDARKAKKDKKSGADEAVTERPRPSGNPVQIAKLEAEIEALTARKNTLEAEMSSHDVAQDPSRLAALAIDYEQVKTDLSAREAAWFDAQA